MTITMKKKTATKQRICSQLHKVFVLKNEQVACVVVSTAFFEVVPSVGTLMSQTRTAAPFNWVFVWTKGFGENKVLI